MHKKRSNSNNLQHWENTNRDHQVEAKKECGNGSSSHCHKGDLCALFRCYEDANRASAYATLEFANTYYLAFRDLPQILSAHVTGLRALDFGCGTGRSTRVLRKLGFDVIGVDISEDMLRIARTTDPSGDYRLVPGDNLNQFAAGSFDLVLCAFPFDNVPGAMKTRIFRDLRRVLASTGTIVNLVSSPE